MGRPGTSYMGLTQANTSKQDESRSLAVVPMVDGPDGISHCDPHVPVGHGRGQQAGGAAELGSPPQRPDLRSGSLEVPSRAHHAAASSQAFCSRFRSPRAYARWTSISGRLLWRASYWAKSINRRRSPDWLATDRQTLGFHSDGSLFRCDARLMRDKTGVSAMCSKQFSVRPSFDDSSCLHDQDCVRSLNSRQTMGNDE
jgi:hypothetical protein